MSILLTGSSTNDSKTDRLWRMKKWTSQWLFGNRTGTIETSNHDALYRIPAWSPEKLRSDCNRQPEAEKNAQRRITSIGVGHEFKESVEFFQYCFPTMRSKHVAPPMGPEWCVIVDFLKKRTASKLKWALEEAWKFPARYLVLRFSRCSLRRACSWDGLFLGFTHGPTRIRVARRRCCGWFRCGRRLLRRRFAWSCRGCRSWASRPTMPHGF